MSQYIYIQIVAITLILTSATSTRISPSLRSNALGPDSSKPPAGIVKPPGDPDVPMIFPTSSRAPSSSPPSGIIKPPGDPEVPMIFPGSFLEVEEQLLPGGIQLLSPPSTPPSGVVKPPGDPDVPMIFPSQIELQEQERAKTEGPDTKTPPTGVVKPPGDPEVPMIFPEAAFIQLDERMTLKGRQIEHLEGWDNTATPLFDVQARLGGHGLVSTIRRQEAREQAPAVPDASGFQQKQAPTVNERVHEVMKQLDPLAVRLAHILDALPSLNDTLDSIVLPVCMMEEFLVAFNDVSRLSRCVIGSTVITDDLSSLRDLKLSVKLKMSPLSLRLEDAAELCTYLMTFEEVGARIKHRLIRGLFEGAHCRLPQYLTAVKEMSKIAQLTSATPSAAAPVLLESSSKLTEHLHSETSLKNQQKMSSEAQTQSRVQQQSSQQNTAQTQTTVQAAASAVTSTHVASVAAHAAAVPSLFELRFGGATVAEVPLIENARSLPVESLTSAIGDYDRLATVTPQNMLEIQAAVRGVPAQDIAAVAAATQSSHDEALMAPLPLISSEDFKHIASASSSSASSPAVLHHKPGSHTAQSGAIAFSPAPSADFPSEPAHDTKLSSVNAHSVTDSPGKRTPAMTSHQHAAAAGAAAVHEDKVDAHMGVEPPAGLASIPFKDASHIPFFGGVPTMAGDPSPVLLSMQANMDDMVEHALKDAANLPKGSFELPSVVSTAKPAQPPSNDEPTFFNFLQLDQQITESSQFMASIEQFEFTLLNVAELFRDFVKAHSDTCSGIAAAEACATIKVHRRYSISARSMKSICPLFIAAGSHHFQSSAATTSEASNPLDVAALLTQAGMQDYLETIVANGMRYARDLMMLWPRSDSQQDSNNQYCSLSTPQGIVRFTPEELNIFNFSLQADLRLPVKTDGLPEVEFCVHTAFDSCILLSSLQRAINSGGIKGHELSNLMSVLLRTPVDIMVAGFMQLRTASQQCASLMEKLPSTASLHGLETSISLPAAPLRHVLKLSAKDSFSTCVLTEALHAVADISS